MSILDEAKKVFLTDVDDATYKENLAVLREWERELLDNEALAEWQKHDVTKKFIQKAKSEYLNYSVRLANDRDLTDEDRASIFARKDACMLIFELAGSDAEKLVRELTLEIKKRVALFNG